MRIAFAALAFAAASAAHAQEAPTLDADRDGKVTLAEFKAGQGERNFARLDADRDGKVTAAEVEAVRAANPSAPDRPRAGGGRMLMMLDKDKDGGVSRTEMAVLVERRFKAADANRDGWLSTGELFKMRQNQGRGSN